MRSPVEILRTLVAIPSVSSLSNAPLLDAIQALLEPSGWCVQRFPYVAADGREKANMVAMPKRFQNHARHRNAFRLPYRYGAFSKRVGGATQLSEADGFLHGCGSCDVKGSMAGLLSAAIQVDPENIATPVAFAFTAEERDRLHRSN